MRRPSFASLVFATAGFSLIGALPTQATILYDNLSNLSVFQFPFSAFGQVYASFSTGGSAIGLNDVKLALLVADPSDGDAITVALFANSVGNIPGSNLAALGTVQDSDLTTSGYTDVDLSFSDIPLAANTRYWIGLSSPGSGIWDAANDSSGTGIAGEFWSDNVGTFPNGNNPQFDTPPVMSVSGDPIPEPLTLSVLGAGVAGAVGIRKLKPRS